MSAAESSETKTVTLTVPSSMKSRRLDTFLASQPSLSLTRTKAQKLIAEGLVLVDGKAVAKNYPLKGGEHISVTIPPPPKVDLAPEDIPLEIVFEDEFLAVVNKPAGLVTHPGAGNYSGTLVNALIHHFGTLAHGSGVERPGIVHRLDKDTSGLIVVAKTDETYLALQQQMQERKINRTYLALICGHMPSDEGTIELPIGRSPKDRKKMAVVSVGSRQAKTSYTVKRRFRTYDLLAVRLHTGRTHQIRVHFSHVGHPVFGDPEYGGRNKWHRGIFGPERRFARRLLGLIDRQALHAYKLEFTHPHSKEPLSFQCPLPADFARLLQVLEEEGQ